MTEQTGIKAGDGGFQIKTAGNTDLKGAMIASTDKAVTDNKNSLSTGTLTHSDLRNKAEYDASSMGFSGGYSFIIGDAVKGGTSTPEGAKADADMRAEAGANVSAPILLSAKDDASSTTRSGISGAVITITDEEKQKALTGQTADEAVAGVNRDVSSDKDGSNALKPIFDEREIQARFEITSAFIRETGVLLESKAKESTEARKELEKERAKPADQQDAAKIADLQQTLRDNQTWEVGGANRAVLMALSAAAGGNVMGSGVEFLQSAAVNYLQGLAAQQVKLIADSLDSEVARGALHGIVGCAGAAAQSQSCGAGALGGSLSVVLNNLIDQISGEEGAGLTPEQKETRRNLVAALASGVTAAVGGDAAVANTAAQIETENNALWVPVILGVVWLADKGMTAYDAWQDIQALQSGEMTLEELALKKGEEYVVQVIAGNLGKYGMRAIKSGGQWVAEKVGRNTDEVAGHVPSAPGSAGQAIRPDGLPVEQVTAGSKGNWDKAVNGDLKPRTAYELDNGHTYITDAAGRVKTVEGKLDLTKMDRNVYQQCKVGHCGNPGDDGGHLIASSLGGAGDKINMVPQAAALNRGDWRSMENTLRKELEAGKSVTVKIEVGYSAGSGARPDKFTVYANVEGIIKEFSFVQ